MHKRSAVVPGAAARVADTEVVPRPEDLFPIVEIPRRLPPRPSGRRLHPKVALRWTIDGSHGVVLQHVCSGRQKLTCDNWLMEFLAAVAATKRATRKATSKTGGLSAARAARTAKLLEDSGLEGARR